MNRFQSSALHLAVTVFACALILLIGGTASAQSITDGSTPLALSPGAPAGSYALSDFDSVNLYNGNLSFRLPLVKIAGRGGAGYTMVARIEHKWLVEKERQEAGQPNLYVPNPNWWSANGFDSIYSMGRMDVRQSGSDDYIIACSAYIHRETLTRMTFTAPDGTEYELRDQLTNGRPDHPTCSTGFNRGRVFVTADGSSATFTSDEDISDYLYDNPGNYPPAGYLVLRDGTRFRIDQGVVMWMRDRNGNKVTFTYGANQRVTGVTDSLNREITIVYRTQVEGYDQITLKGFGGATRTIKIYQSYLQDALRSDFSLQTYQQLFPELNGAYNVASNLPVISAVELPNGQQYQFRYNSYAELARVVLPTGGAIEYDHAAGLTDGAASGVLPIFSGDKHIYRRVIERRVYPDGGTGTAYATRMTYSRPETLASNAGYVVTDQLNSAGSLLNRSQHHFYGSARASFNQQPTQYGGWKDGSEYQTTVFAADGTTPLRQVTKTFAQRVPVSWWTGSSDQEPPNDPRLVETVTTLSDTNQVSKQTSINPSDPNDKGFDQYNNQTDVWEFDYGAGAPGSLVRHTHTSFVSAANYTGPDVNLLGLPAQTSVYDGAGVERARATFEYDNYTTDTNHAALVSRSAISGFDASFGTSYPTRGNVTATTNYLLTNGSVTGSVTSYAQYDIAGNPVKAIDARGYATTLDYSDRFGSPDGEARSNSSATELAGQYSYAFPTLVTNALGHTGYTQFDYYLGRPVDGEDANGIVSSGHYSDALDRPTQVIRAANQGVGIKSQSAFSYDDINHVVTTTSDQSSYGDNLLKSQAVYDGLGRTTEKRQYETPTGYITVRQTYDALGRSYQTSNPFRAGETVVWTTAAYDVLSRVTSVTTPDSAVVTTAYSGNTVTVTDQTGKARKSVTDGLGRLLEVYEDPAGLNYLTSYSYDALDNLTVVNQGSQTRTFVYDSLKRLTSATNPESGVVGYQYDNNGNLLVKTEARGVSAHYAYDALNRAVRRWSNGSSLLTATTHNNPALPAGVGASDEVKYFYDSQTLASGAPSYSRGFSTGRLVATTYGTASSAGDYYSFDATGRSVLKIQQTGTVNYQTSAVFSLSDAITSQTYPSGHTTTYTYDQAGRTTSLSGNLGDGTTRTYSTGIIYSSLGGMTKEQFGTTTPVYNKLFYNVRGQLSEIRESTGYTGPTDTTWDRGAIVNHYSNTCVGMCSGQSMTDNNGNLKKQEVFIPNSDSFAQFYEYDSLNRLQRANESKNGAPVNWQQQYSYDRYGNRTIDQTNTWGTGIPKPNFGVNTATNRLTAPAGYTMSYDSAGNLTNDTFTGEGTRTFDAENRMTGSAGILPATYSYDGDGRRMKRNVNGAETWQVYGIGGELVAEYAAGASPPTPQKEYGYRNGQLLITATVTSGWGTAPTIHDNPLVVADTTIQARHITELRTAIDSLRTHMSMSAYSWQYSVTTNDWITTNPILEMRTALDQALGAPSGGYSAGLTQGQQVKAIHIQELRDRVLAAWTSGSSTQINWLVADQLGTPRMIFDQTGSLASVSRHDYLPFGEELFSGIGGRTAALGYTNSDAARQKFTLKERDNETNLDWFGPGRYYSSTQGRFTSVDPSGAGAQAVNPQSLNGYTYTLNRPTIAIDPDGLSTIVVTVTVPAGGGNPTASIIFYGKLGDGGALAAVRYDGLAAGQGRDRMVQYNDTPYGTYSFDGTQGGTAESRLDPGFGTGKVIITGLSGEIIESGRSLIRLHGGGTALGDHAYDLQQELRPTQGCVRMHNGDVNELIGLTRTAATNNDPLDRVFVGSADTLNTTANQTDRNGTYVNPDLRLAMGMYRNEQERQTLITTDANRRAEVQRQREEQQRQRQERQRRRRPEDE